MCEQDQLYIVDILNALCVVCRVIYRPACGAGVLPGWNAVMGSSQAVPGCHFGFLRNN